MLVLQLDDKDRLLRKSLRDQAASLKLEYFVDVDFVVIEDNRPVDAVF